MTWRESEHPRHPAGTDQGGEFRDKPDWVAAVSNQIAGIPVYRPIREIDPALARRYYELVQEALRLSDMDRDPLRRTPEWQAADHKVRTELYDVKDKLTRGTWDREAGIQYDPDGLRLHSQAQIDYYSEQYRAHHYPDMTTEQFRQLLAEKAKKEFAGRSVAVRTTPAGLTKILADGRFKTSFEPGATSRGLKDANVRAIHEASLWGYARDVDPQTRPVYGYLMDTVRYPETDVWEDALAQYGRIQVVLRDNVRSRTTAMFGDSLDMKHQGRPSPVDNPTWESWSAAMLGGIGNSILMKKERDLNDPAFRSISYAEAQVHGGVRTDDIAEVVFPSRPPKAIQTALSERSIPWRVVSKEVGS